MHIFKKNEKKYFFYKKKAHMGFFKFDFFMADIILTLYTICTKERNIC